MITVTMERAPRKMPSAGQGHLLSGRNARATNTVRGWPALLLGVPFVAAGLAMPALVAGWLGVTRGGPPRMPLGVVAALGAAFAVVGLTFLWYGVDELRRRAAQPALRARYADQPWLWDYAWDRRGGRDESVGDIGRALSTAAFFALFLTPFHWAAFGAAGHARPFQLVTLLFDLVVAALVGRALYLAARRARYGRSRLRFTRFPIVPGSDAVLDVTDVSPLARRHPLVATLRCVQERFEMSGTGRRRKRVTVLYEIMCDERTIAPNEATVRFAIPADAPTTALGDLPPRYWELELRADGVPGVDYGARFLVPVYGGRGPGA